MASTPAQADIATRAGADPRTTLPAAHSPLLGMPARSDPRAPTAIQAMNRISLPTMCTAALDSPGRRALGHRADLAPRARVVVHVPARRRDPVAHLGHAVQARVARAATHAESHD